MARSKKAQAAIDGALSLNAPSGQVGLGVDLVEVDRMRRILVRTPSFARRVFSEDEVAYCESHVDPAMHYAARFAAKEAVVKALGTGFSQGIGFRDIEVVRDSKGRPAIALSNGAKQAADEMGVTDMPVSLSHTDNDAVACVIAITVDACAATMKRIDPAEELARQFKETRSLLDEIGKAPTSDGAEDA